jgi:acetolactate synthase-1/2/3 large subunit
MTGEPAVTLLHLGPGYGNGWANLHNARKGHAPMVNVVGGHAGYHLKYDAPLQADLEGVVRSASARTRRIETAEDVSRDTAAAIRAARSAGGQLTTLILPSEVAWSDVGAAALEVAAPPPRPHRPDRARIEAVIDLLKDSRHLAERRKQTFCHVPCENNLDSMDFILALLRGVLNRG